MISTWTKSRCYFPTIFWPKLVEIRMTSTMKHSTLFMIRKLLFATIILIASWIEWVILRTHKYIQLRDLAIKHLKYWLRISSILERTKYSTKTSNTSFERSDSWLSKSWKLGAWHSYWLAMPTLYDKWNFLEEEGVTSPWCCHAPVLQIYFCPLSGLSNEILYVNVPFLLFQ